MVLMMRARPLAGMALGAALVLGGPVLSTSPLAPLPLAAQASAPRAAAVQGQGQEAAGWIGVRLTYQVSGQIGGPVGGPVARLPQGRATGREAGQAARPGASGPLLPEPTQEIRVTQVVDGGPAQRGGLQAGDLLLRVDDLEAGLALREGHLDRVRPGQRVRFLVARGSDEAPPMEVSVVAGVRPPPESLVAAVSGAPSPVQYRTTVIRIPGAGSASETVRLTRPHFQVDSLARLRIETRAWGRPQPQGQSWSPAGAQGSVPILVYASGQRVVLGAEVTPLNAGLAGYFGVDSGLLVTQVLEGAPAERAGLVPGDVIRFVGGAPVTTVEELRQRADRGLQSPPLILGVVREGRAMELRLAR